MHCRPHRIPRLAAPLLTSLTLGACAEDNSSSDSFASVSISGGQGGQDLSTSGATDPGTTGATDSSATNDPTGSPTNDPTGSPTNDPTGNPTHSSMGYTSMMPSTTGYDTMGYQTMGYGSSGPYGSSGQYGTSGAYGSSGYETMGYGSSGGECKEYYEDCQSSDECCGGYCDQMYGICY